MTAYIVIGCIVMVNLVVSFFGGKLGYSVNGQASPFTGNVVADSISFFSDMMLFRIDGMVDWLVLIFWFMNIMVVFTVVRMIRGNN